MSDFCEAFECSVSLTFPGTDVTVVWTATAFHEPLSPPYRCHTGLKNVIRFGLALRVKPVLNWANVCSPNILRTFRRTMIRFLIELLVRRTWFGQFDELYFVLNWLVMR